MELIRRIYKNDVMESSDMDALQALFVKEVEELTKDQKSKMSIVEYEQYREIIFSIIYLVEEECFIHGFKYGTKLLLQEDT